MNDRCCSPEHLITAPNNITMRMWVRVNKFCDSRYSSCPGAGILRLRTMHAHILHWRRSGWWAFSAFHSQIPLDLWVGENFLHLILKFPLMYGGFHIMKCIGEHFLHFILRFPLSYGFFHVMQCTIDRSTSSRARNTRREISIRSIRPLS